MPTMSVGTCFLYAYITAKRYTARKSWRVFALSGTTTVLMVPFTWFLMSPVNNQLFGLKTLGETDPHGVGIDETKKLVVIWWWLHLTRSLFPLLGAVIGSVGTF